MSGETRPAQERRAIDTTMAHSDRAEVAHFFDGLDLVEPGLVPVQQWRPASDLEARARSAMWGGVALKL